MHGCPRTCGGMDSGGRPAQTEMGMCREKTQAGPDPSRTGTVIGWGSGRGSGGRDWGEWVWGREECWRVQPLWMALSGLFCNHQQAPAKYISLPSQACCKVGFMDALNLPFKLSSSVIKRQKTVNFPENVSKVRVSYMSAWSCGPAVSGIGNKPESFVRTAAFRLSHRA